MTVMKEDWPPQPMPRGILLILCLFLMLAGNQISISLHSISSLFPVNITKPIVVNDTGLSIVLWLFYVVLSMVYLSVVYSWYIRVTWSRLFTIWVATIHSIYDFIAGTSSLVGFIVSVGTNWSTNFSGTGITDFTVAMLVINIFYHALLATIMLYVIRYLKKPEAKEWFVSLNKEEQIESPL